MSDRPPPQARVSSGPHRRRRFSIVWVIPIVTVAIGAWLAWHTLSQRGPVITIAFQTAEGLQAGQSRVRHKDVEMGQVTNVALSADLSHAVITVQMNADAEPLLTDKARFWVVKPRFFAGSISGLDTLLSGSYIELSPSSAGGAPKRDFVGLEDPPVLQSDTPGSTFLLRAARLGSISLGSPVYYRDLPVGEVLGWDVADMADFVTIHTFVREPFNQYVHADSRFWNASGVSVKLSGSGVNVQLESLRALILGGIAFDTPSEDHPPAGPPPEASKSGTTFPLFANKEAADSAGYQRKLPFVSYFDGSVAGLQAGADVLVRGIKVGTITSVGLRFDAARDTVVVPVRYTVEPQRISEIPMRPMADIQSGIAELVAHGLRARLDSASLITGQKQVSLDFVPDAKPATTGKDGDSFIIPVVPDAFADLTSSAGAIMAKLKAIPFEQIGDNLNATLKGAAGIANDSQLKDAVASLQATLKTAQITIQQVDAGLQPTLKKLPEIANGLQETVNRANRVLSSVDTGYGGNSDFHRSLERMLGQLTDTAASVRVLADLLSRHPEALIRGRTDQGQQ
ncbi:MAG: MCE family protein [Proteobacteria bacterium]|nr:MCE family protein [Pseudomonadota bacterium]